MTSPRHKNTKLHVIATPLASVKEIDENGKPLMDCRIVGKSANRDVIEGGVIVPYHAHYVARLKEGSFLPGNLETARLAGVPFSQPEPQVKMDIKQTKISKSKDE